MFSTADASPVYLVPVVLQVFLKGFLGLEDVAEVVVDWPIGELLDSPVREEILVHQEGLGLRPQDGQVQHGHVALALDPVQEAADLHAELHGVLGLTRSNNSRPGSSTQQGKRMERRIHIG